MRYSNRGYTILHCVIMYFFSVSNKCNYLSIFNNNKTSEQLLTFAKYGADVNAVTEMDGDTILHLAYKEDQRELINSIVNELKVDTKIVNKKGKIAEDYKTYYHDKFRLFYSLEKNKVF